MGYIIAFIILFLCWKLISAVGKGAGWIARPIFSELYKSAIEKMKEATGADTGRARMYVHLVIVGVIVLGLMILI